MRNNIPEEVDEIHMKFDDFEGQLAKYFDFCEEPDGSVTHLELKDIITAQHQAEWLNVLDDFGLICYDADGSVCDYKDERFIEELEEYYNDNPMVIDEVRYGCMVMDVFRKHISI